MEGRTGLFSWGSRSDNFGLFGFGVFRSVLVEINSKMKKLKVYVTGWEQNLAQRQGGIS